MADLIPKRLTDREQWSVEDHFAFRRTGELPVNPDWVSQKKEALERAGLETDDADAAPADLDDATSADHAKRKYGTPRT